MSTNEQLTTENNTEVKTEKHKPFNALRIKLATNLIFNTYFIFVSLACIVPLLIVVMASITDDMTLRLEGYTLFPSQFSFTAYEFIFRRGDAIVQAFMNSIIITLVGTFCGTLIMALYAYPLSRSNFKYRNGFTWLVLITMLFSGGLVPWYIMYTQVLGLLDTMAALIIPYTMSAWYVLIMRTFYKSALPEEIVESARIDGANEFRIFFSIALPLSTAGIATISLFTMLAYWND